MGKSPPAENAQRSFVMSRIKGRDTSIEVRLRKALWAAGIRYRKNYKKLPGTPDIAITKHRIAIFCDGEFWHGKDWESAKSKLRRNRDYWIDKIEGNMAREGEVEKKLLYSMGWIVIRFWGEDIKKDLPGCVEEIKDLILQAKINERTNTGPCGEPVPSEGD